MIRSFIAAPVAAQCTFLALQSSYTFHCHAVHLVILDIVVEFLVNTVEFVSGTIGIEINLALAVAVNAPTHAKL